MRELLALRLFSGEPSQGDGMPFLILSHRCICKQHESKVIIKFTTSDRDNRLPSLDLYFLSVTRSLK